MPTFLRKLFEQYAKRLLTNKVRPSILEEGIMTIPNNKRVQLMAENLYKDFKKAGVPDNILKTENDIKVFHHKIAEMNNENVANRLGTFEDIFAPKKSAEVFDLKGKKIKNPDNIMGGEEIIETEAQILKRLNKENKESLSNIRYEAASKAEEAKAAADEDYIMKIFDPEDFSKGGRAGLYQGGQAQIEPDLSDIGHGSDALMARNALLTPGSQATTSTGLNYLLGQDNDTTRVPYKHGDMVLPKEKPMNEYMLKQLMSQAGAETLDARTREMFIQMYKKKIREKNKKAEGGPARQNFSMGKRAFLKWMASGAAGIAGLKTGLLGFGKKTVAKSVIAPATQAANEAAVPPYFLNLVKKIKNLGDDVTETGALAERQNVKRYKDFELTEDKVTGRQEITKYKVDDDLVYDGSEYYGKPLTEETYMSYTPGETIIGKGGKPVKTQPEYEEGRALLRNDRGNKGEIVEEIEGVSDDVIKEGTIFEDTLSEFGKADGGRIGYKLGKKVVETVIKKAGEGKFTKNEVLLNMFQNTIKQSKSPDTKKRFTNFIEEIKLKPELSKDPNVWNFFTKGLPKNQKLVVYGDDTVDFWTQSEFGPHNIATSAKFQKKHPYLTKDQAVKIQNMEPEDQIFEMKRLEAIRKRTANASGGLAAMLGE